MPSFDIVSQTDLAEVDNALQNLAREITQRYDFKGSNSRVERKDTELTIHADDDLKLKQMHELLQGHLAKRKIEPGVLDYQHARERLRANPSGRSWPSRPASTRNWPGGW